MSFTIFQNEKTPFQAIKARSSKSRKIDIFLKALTHGFGPKMAIFHLFFFRQYRAGKGVLRYSRTNKTPFKVIKTRSSKSPKIGIFPKGLTHRFWLKIKINKGEQIYDDFDTSKKAENTVYKKFDFGVAYQIFPKSLSQESGSKLKFCFVMILLLNKVSKDV